MYDSFAYSYDELTENVEYYKRAEYIGTLLNRYGIEKNATVLDLACGTGSLTVELSKKGYEMIGVDISEEMLAQAQSKIYENGLDILLLKQDMTELDLFGTVDCAVCMLDSLNHLKSADDVKRAISNVGLFMNPNGIFIFDVNTIYKHRNVLANNTFIYDCEKVYCVWQNTLNDDDSVDINLDIFECEDEAYFRSNEFFTERAYELELIEKWLNEAEFAVINIFDEMTDNPINEKTERAVFVARYTGKRRRCNG